MAILLVTSLVTFGAIALSPLLPRANAVICGFDGVVTSNLGSGTKGYYEKANYTNCGKKNQHISVKYTYASRGMCVTPGTTVLYANPDLGALRDAKNLGSC